MLWLLFLRETFWKRAKHVLRLDLNKNDPNKTKIVSEQKTYQMQMEKERFLNKHKGFE